MGRSKDAIRRTYMKPQYFPCRNIWGGCTAHGSFLTTQERDQHEGPCLKAFKKDKGTRVEAPSNIDGGVIVCK
jgi:hypothetical protein